MSLIGVVAGVPPGGFGQLRDRAGDYDAAYEQALDAGLCDEAAADYAYDAWRWPGRRSLSDEDLEAEYGYRCRENR